MTKGLRISRCDGFVTLSTADPTYVGKTPEGIEVTSLHVDMAEITVSVDGTAGNAALPSPPPGKAGKLPSCPGAGGGQGARFGRRGHLGQHLLVAEKALPPSHNLPAPQALVESDDHGEGDQDKDPAMIADPDEDDYVDHAYYDD